MEFIQSHIHEHYSKNGSMFRRKSEVLFHVTKEKSRKEIPLVASVKLHIPSAFSIFSVIQCNYIVCLFVPHFNRIILH